jgi:hypothetical protein
MLAITLMEEAVAEITQDQANQVRGIGAQISGRDVVHISQLIDSRLNSLDGGIGDFPFGAAPERRLKPKRPPV